MRYKSADLGVPFPSDAQMPGIDGDGAMLTPDLDDGTDLSPEYGHGSDPHDAARPGAAQAREPSASALWNRLLVGVMALLLALGAAILAPSHPALAETAIGDPIPAAAGPIAIGVNPTTNRIYVVNSGSGSVTVIDGATDTTIGAPIQTALGAFSIGVNASTNRVYVANFFNATLTVIDGATNTVVGSPIPTGASPRDVGVNPVTNRIYVAQAGSDADHNSNTVLVIDGAANAPIGAPILVGKDPRGVAVNPSTNLIYVTNAEDGTVSVIDGATNKVIGAPIPVGKFPSQVGMNTASKRIYVSNFSDDTVSVINSETNAVISSPLHVGVSPFGIGIKSATNEIFVTNFGDGTVSVIDGAANTVVGKPVQVKTNPIGVGVNPNTPSIYVANSSTADVTVLGVPLSTRASTTLPGGSFTATWSSLFVTNGADFVGLFEPGAPNTSPLSRRFTNGTASPGGAGVGDGSVDVPIPNGLAAGASFEVRLVAGSNATTVARIRNAAPVAANDSFTVAAANTLSVLAPGLLANDTDQNSPSLLATVVTNPAHGTISLQPNGAFVYTPNVSFVGTDSFTYGVTDQSGLPATATVTITVTAPPIGANDAFTDVSGVALNVPAPGVLANDTDPDSPSLQTVLVANPAHGTLSLQSNGAFTYTPNADFAGADGFTYRASDGSSTSAPVTVTISVTATPVAANDAFSVTAGTALNAAAPGVLTNDTDADSPSLQATVVASPTHGTLALQATGAFTYTPNADFAGADTFTYQASDGSTQSNPATVTITVTPTDCAPRPRVQTAPAAGGGKLQVHVESTPLNTHQPNPLRSIRFGTFQNGKVTLGGQPITSGQTFTVASSSAVDFTVGRETPGQATTVPFTVVDGCGDFPTFVGGGTSAGF